MLKSKQAFVCLSAATAPAELGVLLPQADKLCVNGHQLAPLGSRVLGEGSEQWLRRLVGSQRAR